MEKQNRPHRVRRTLSPGRRSRALRLEAGRVPASAAVPGGARKCELGELTTHGSAKPFPGPPRFLHALIFLYTLSGGLPPPTAVTVAMSFRERRGGKDGLSGRTPGALELMQPWAWALLGAVTTTLQSRFKIWLIPHPWREGGKFSTVLKPSGARRSVFLLMQNPLRERRAAEPLGLMCFSSCP